MGGWTIARRPHGLVRAEQGSPPVGHTLGLLGSWAPDLLSSWVRAERGIRGEVCIAMGRIILENPLVSNCQPQVLLFLGELCWMW